MFPELKNKILQEENILSDILGQKSVKQQLKSALLCGRHVIISGPPGIGKTTLAKNIAKLLGKKELNDCGYNCSPENPQCPICKNSNQKTITLSGLKRFVRVQGSPDLTAEDLIGDIDPIKAMKFGPLSLEAFTPGKIFKANNGVLFFDEVNRCPEKLQNALLQVLEEKKATIGSFDVDIEANFILIATMNPKDINTESLSDVFLDRFDVIHMSYPLKTNTEINIVKKRADFLEINFPETLLQKTVLFVRLLRENENLEKVPSVRASIGLIERSCSNALLSKKNTVDVSDIKKAIISVLSHRISLKPSAKYLQKKESFVKNQFEKFATENELKEGDSP